MADDKQQAWQIHSVRTGPRGGVPVILVHPAGLDLTYWSAQIEALCDEYDVVAFDLPGHGGSPGKAEDWTLDNAASMLAQVVQSTGAAKAHIVGLSVGSVVAQSLVVRRPELVQSLTLMGAVPIFSDAGRKGMAERSKTLKASGMEPVIKPALERWFAQTTITRRPDIIDRATKTMLADDPLVHAALWDMMQEFDTRSQLSAVTCPTLLITGALDQSTPPAGAEAIKGEIAGSEVIIIPGSSHMVTLEEPARVNEALRTFLAMQTS